MTLLTYQVMKIEALVVINSMANGMSGTCCLTSTESQYPYQAYNVSSTQFEFFAVNSSASYADGVKQWSSIRETYTLEWQVN